MTNASLVMTISKEETVILKTDILNFRNAKNVLRDNAGDVAWRVLKHFHNCGNPVLVQEFYDILSEDQNLFRKAAFAKWVQEYSNALFSDSTKKFTKNVNPNAVKVNYQEDSEKGSELLIAAFNNPFWKIEMSADKVNKTLFDSAFESAEKLIKRIEKEVKAGSVSNDETIKEMTVILSSLRALTQPLTTKEIMGTEEPVSEAA